MTPPVRPFSAIVLAAGRSSRMGRDKALIEVEGMPLWRRQREVLVAAGAAEIFLSARPDQAWAQGRTGFSATVHDAMRDCGPLVGLTAGLERASHFWLAVLAIDLPRIPPAWFAELLAACQGGCGVVGRREGMAEPLAAIYPREAMWLAWEALARGEYSLQRFVASAIAQGLLRAREIRADEVAMFANWNRESDRG